jgi:hypothetical protein
MSSTADVQQLLSSNTYPWQATLAKLDIAEFFLSGDHDYLIEAIAQFFPDRKLRGWVQDALWYLCHYQVVEFGGEFFRIQKGSGMGARHSGSLANLAFCAKVELPFFRALKCRGFSISAYARFFDDILLVIPDSRTEQVIELFKSFAKPQFTIEPDAISQVSVPMLDMLVRKVRCGDRCKIVWRPYVKPSAKHLPLHHDSLHAPATHISWPMAEMRRLSKLSFFSHDFENARDLKLARWSQFFLHDSVVSQCRVWSSAQAVVKPVSLPNGVRKVRLILPYHPLLSSLRAPLSELCSVWSARARLLHNFCVDISLSWRSAGMPLHVRLRHLCL